MMHLRNRLPILAVAAVATLALATSASAAENLKILNFKSTVGSFKVLGTDHPAHGHLEFQFSGTVLVSGLGKGTVTPSGDLRLEFTNTAHKKLVYHGTGKLVLDGEFSAVQFFGKNISGNYTGVGIFRFYGEFDKNLNTGEFWYEGGEHKDWGTGGMQVTVPGMVYTGRPMMKASPGVKIKS